MNKRTWVIFGATSIIAESFAHLAAAAEHDILLVGRNKEQLDLIAADLQLRHHIKSTVLIADFSADCPVLLEYLANPSEEIDLFFAFGATDENEQMTPETLAVLCKINIQTTLTLMHAYFNKPQNEHRLIFLSSVAACRGRAKNSLYGGSKAAVETYLEGMQQIAPAHCNITIARLGFIDTVQTFGKPGIFYASSPQSCAKACWQASYAGKRRIYHPFFWRYIMMMIKALPFHIYRKMGKL